MALRNQPYIPLYVQDFLTDEKLRECQASTVGVYIYLICLMHKSEEYGIILLKQKYKQKKNVALGLAHQLTKQLPYEATEIYDALLDLIDEGVCKLNGDSLQQKRMIKDAILSDTRAKAGSKGGFKSKEFAKAKLGAKTLANSESESEYENENIIVINKGVSEFFDLINSEYPRVQKLKSPLTVDEALRLEREYPKETLIDVIDGMENKADLLKKYTSANKTIRSWIKLRNSKQGNKKVIGRNTAEDVERINKVWQ